MNPAAYQERVDAILDIVFGDIEETGTQFVDDAQTDQLFGGEGLDWFISFLFDQVTGTWTEVKDRETVGGTLEVISP